jgi:hypothetical protein
MPQCRIATLSPGGAVFSHDVAIRSPEGSTGEMRVAPLLPVTARLEGCVGVL